VASAAYDGAMLFRASIFGLLLGGAAIVATIVAAQLEDDDVAAPPFRDGVTSPAELPDAFPPGFEVAAVVVTLVGPGPLPLPLDSRNPSDRPVVQRLSDWVVAANPSRQVVDTNYRARRHPIRVTFLSLGGDSVSFFTGYDCEPDEAGTVCNVVSGAIDTERGDQILRLTAPEMAAWLLVGWQRDLRTGTQADFDRDWAATGIVRRP